MPDIILGAAESKINKTRFFLRKVEIINRSFQFRSNLELGAMRMLWENKEGRASLLGGM